MFQCAYLKGLLHLLIFEHKFGDTGMKFPNFVGQMFCNCRKEKFQEIENQYLGILGGEPGGIRTRDPQLRRLLLYPAELPVPNQHP